MPRILLAEDDTSMREYLQRALQRVGYEVAAVGCGTEAMPLLEAERYDLLLTDIVMPGFDLGDLEDAGPVVTDELDLGSSDIGDLLENIDEQVVLGDADRWATVLEKIGSIEYVGWKISDRKAAIGSQRRMTTAFQPARPARSLWIGWTGFRSMPLSSPPRTRSSQAHGVRAMFMFRTRVQTM